MTHSWSTYFDLNQGDKKCFHPHLLFLIHKLPRVENQISLFLIDYFSKELLQFSMK